MQPRKKLPPPHDFPAGVAKPALRALASVGITRLDHCAKWTEDDLSQLHGVGPNALALIRTALTQTGRSFAKPDKR